MLCMLRSCGKCGGDLFQDDDDWRCVQCARYYYGGTSGLVGGLPLVPYSVGEAPRDGEIEDVAELDLATSGGQPDPVYERETYRRRGYRTRATRSINSVIQAKKRGDARWWARNKHIIEYLDQGLSVLEISSRTDRGQRQVRTVRERLADVRAEALGVK